VCGGVAAAGGGRRVRVGGSRRTARVAGARARAARGDSLRV